LGTLWFILISMPSAIYNLIFDKGADYNFGLVFSDQNGNPLNLTGITITAPIYAKEGDANPISSFAVTLDSSTVGRAIFTLSATASSSIIYSKPYFEVWLQYPYNGAHSRYLRGIVNLDK